MLMEFYVYRPSDKKPSVTLTQDPEYKVMFPGESVSFSCNIKVSSGWKYQWYKDGKHLGHSKKTYPVKSIETTSGGLYKCEVQRGTDEVVTYSSQPIPLKVEGEKLLTSSKHLFEVRRPLNEFSS